jgi:pilus assembly protein CpaF
MKSAVAADVRAHLLRTGQRPDVAAVREGAVDKGWVVDDVALAELAVVLSRDLSGFGPLQAYLDDPTVTDVMVNGADDVWVDRGEGLTRAEVRFEDDLAVRRLAVRLAESCGRRLDDAAPFVDAALPHGVRLHAVLPPLVDRIAVSLRIPRHRSWSLDDLVRSGAVAAAAVDLLRQMVVGHWAFLVTGGTGSGKTTLLNALLAEVDPRERLVIVEDTRELRPVHPHVVRVQTRPPNIEGAGGVDMQTLVRQSLRMRPDRIVVGEVRGPEVVDLLTALNTGHRGGCGTVHANSAPDVLPRLEVLGALGGLAEGTVRRLAGVGLDATVHLERDGRGRRYVRSLAMVVDATPAAEVQMAFTFDAAGGVEQGPMADAWLRGPQR